jgi:5-enolpyruvylshikimate-3-phosphate synthase
MTLGVAGLVAKDAVVISGSEAVDVSYPGFWDDMDMLTTN